mmetsp:Transcript_11394/g.16981  ORF Transcript_11394/g.16981 Transcript_11394/m.16981 type:complete len:91 (-) Transcript_11394:1602-1874(-)
MPRKKRTLAQPTKDEKSFKCAPTFFLVDEYFMHWKTSIKINANTIYFTHIFSNEIMFLQKQLNPKHLLPCHQKYYLQVGMMYHHVSSYLH